MWAICNCTFTMTIRACSISFDTPRLDQVVIRRLVDILRDNPYSQTFRSLGQAEDMEEYHISVNTDPRMDQQTYNVPLSSKVAVVWIEGNDLIKKFNRSIVLYGNNNVKVWYKAILWML